MKQSQKFSNAIHIMTSIALANDEDEISSKQLADSIVTNPVVVRNLMSKLKKANLIQSTAGVAKPALTRPADEITLYDIYSAVEDTALLKIKMDTNPDCPLGSIVPEVVGEFFSEIELTAQKEMQHISLQSIVDEVQLRMH